MARVVGIRMGDGPLGLTTTGYGVGRARTLAEAAPGLLAMARLAAPSDRPQALELLNSFRIEQDQRQVRVTAQVSQQLLNELIPEKPQSFLPHGRPHREGHRKPESH